MLNKMNWAPLKFVVSRFARSKGFLDPFNLFAQLGRFGQPSEVIAPTELLRVGAVMHARGLINAQAIQHNLDWIWPYWISRQFDPLDPSFVPRAFSLTHINLTHRNWTAVGLPDVAELPVVDPRGLVMPYFDGFTIDAWIIAEDGTALLPSRLKEAEQRYLFDDGLKVETISKQNGMELTADAEVLYGASHPYCSLKYEAVADKPAWLALAIRPCNTEGISFVHEIELAPDRTGWIVNGDHEIAFGEAPDRHALSEYHSGDVFRTLPHDMKSERVECNVGMASAAAMYALQPGEKRTVTLTVPLHEREERRELGEKDEIATSEFTSWEKVLKGHTTVRIPDEHLQFLYDAAIRSLVLHSPGEVYPGPYTYKRFWFRDAAYIINALLCGGFPWRAERALAEFPKRQLPTGYFCSQTGEWDSNGQAIWIMKRFLDFTGRDVPSEWEGPIERAAHWIKRKRIPNDSEGPAPGLLPAGFSAEHLGPNDYYYWDDFWSVGGLLAASELMKRADRVRLSEEFGEEAADLMKSVVDSLDEASRRLKSKAMPAAPRRRFDAGMIGNVAAGYPLQLWPENDERLIDTAEKLVSDFFVDGGFFQDMIHSGINAYLTLHVGQIFLRADDPRYRDCLEATARIASPTGQWPEAVHPQTKGGCMGDGHHIWASAEWVIFIRNLFLREEDETTLVLGQGIFPEWLEEGKTAEIHDALTEFGRITIKYAREDGAVVARWEADWHRRPEKIVVYDTAGGSRTVSADESEIRF